MTKSFQMLAISPVHHYILGLHLVWASRCTALIYLERALPKRVSIGLVYSSAFASDSDNAVFTRS